MLAPFHLPMPRRAACSHQPSVFRSGHLRAPLLKASLCTPSMLSSSRSAFAGTLLSRGTQQQSVSRRGVIVEANSKTSIGITKRGTRRARTRTSGFRARMQTPSGRAVLRARRKKGRHTLCPASNYRK